MIDTLPTVTRVYRNWCVDSTRWSHFITRAGDVTVVTPYKSGTTWMLNIVGHFVFNDLRQRDLRSFGRWLEAPWRPIADEIADLDAMPHRRVMKTHLALDGLPYDPAHKYIYVGRDLRDAFMSLWHHHSHYTPELWDVMANTAEANGVAMSPPCPADVRSFYADWISRGWFDWEHDGFPYWSATHHLKTWWDFRHLPNVRFVHFNDLLADLEGEIAGIAAFLGCDLGAKRYGEIASLCTFAAMKRDAEIVNPGAHFGFRGGPATFINKGTNGRWREVLTQTDLLLYREAVARVLPSDAVAWLETGRAAQTRQPAAALA